MIYTEQYTLSEVDTAEVMRYAGVKNSKGREYDELDECLEICGGVTSGSVRYSRVTVSVEDGRVFFPFVTVESHDLSLCLKDCDEAVIFAATVGGEIDRIIKKYTLTEPVYALWAGAIGSERVENLCDIFNDAIKTRVAEEGRETRPRYSPGYGDVSLSYQKAITEYLETEKIGISLNESMLMTPTKSVTAIIGIKKKG